AGPVVGPVTGQVFVTVFGNDGVPLASAVGAAALDLLFDAIALVRGRTGRESAVQDGLGHGCGSSATVRKSTLEPTFDGRWAGQGLHRAAVRSFIRLTTAWRVSMSG